MKFKNSERGRRKKESACKENGGKNRRSCERDKTNSEEAGSAGKEQYSHR